jgi:hypothetical protein
LESPFNALLCEQLAQHLDDATEFGRRVNSWTGPPVSDALALRAAGAFHALARSGRAPRLTAQYPPTASGEPESLWGAISEALVAHEDFLCEYLEGPPQTNEVGRSSALLGAALLIAERTGLPMTWDEIGASAGLNLAFDQYRYELGAARYGHPKAPVTIRSLWQGAAPALGARLQVAERAGVDLNPLVASSAASRERLLSYIWPDHAERIERTLAALDAAAAAPWRVERAAAEDWVEARFLRAPTPDRVHVLAHTVVWQYLSESEQNNITAIMNEAGRRATARAPVAWFSMEADGVGEGAGLHLSVWPGGERALVGRADFHGRWVRWL